MTGSRATALISDPLDPLTDILERALVGHGPVLRLGCDATDDELRQVALRSSHLVAIGDRVAAREALLGAASLPGVRRLLVVVWGGVDLQPLRRRGVPYTVVQAAPLAEDVLKALAPSLERGWLHLSRGQDPALALVSREDLARCVAAALLDDGCCGRTVAVAAPERWSLAQLAQRAAAAQGRRLRLVQAPRWAARPLAALGRRPFELPAELVREVPREDLTALHPGPWQEVEALVAGAPAARAG